MPTNYLPWWLGGILLAAVAVLFPLLAGAPLGVSGALARLLNWRGDKAGGAVASKASVPSDCSAPPVAGTPGPDRVANLVFVAAMAVGGAVAGKVGGIPWGHAAQPADFQRLFGQGARGLAVLFVGGILVGFGTRWSGGCTSGHGLSGVGRLQPASLAATAAFFGVAIVVSFALERILS
jgi:hypothetical protein